MEEKIFGYVPSKLDGTERVYKGTKSEDLPNSYSYKYYMPEVINQGELSICVPCSVSAYLNWKENLKNGIVKDNRIDLMEIYNCRSNKGEGMSFKDALHYLRHKGVNSRIGKLNIDSYAMIKNAHDLRYALVMNGPCIGALPVYSDRPEFWVKCYGDRLVGYHAISIVGYDEEGFYIRNSWGSEFADNGYTYIKEKDFGKLLEIWTIID